MNKINTNLQFEFLQYNANFRLIYFAASANTYHEVYEYKSICNIVYIAAHDGVSLIACDSAYNLARKYAVDVIYHSIAKKRRKFFNYH